MGTDASATPTIDAPRAGQAFVDRPAHGGLPEPKEGPQAGLAPRQDPPLMSKPESKVLDELIERVRASTRRSVGTFVADPRGLVGFGVIGQDERGPLVMELPVPYTQLPEDVVAAIDTIRLFLDNTLNDERAALRRMLS